MGAKCRFAGVAALLVFSLIPVRPAAADTLTLAALHYDSVIPSCDGCPDVMFSFDNISDIVGLTTPVTFTDATLSLTRAGGAATSISLGDVAPGASVNGFTLADLLFSDDVEFLSAMFSATLDRTMLTLDDGTVVFTDAAVIASLSNPDGSPLVADAAGVSIDVDTTTTTPVPEPSSIVLVAAGLAAAVRKRIRLGSR